jgi:hypothetical protein
LPGNGSVIPTAILSIPIIRRTIGISRIIVFVVIPGYARVTIVKIMAIAPRPTSINRNAPGDFLLLVSSELEECTVVKHHSPYR